MRSGVGFARVFLVVLALLLAQDGTALAQEDTTDDMDWGMDWGQEAGLDPALGGEDSEPDYMGNAKRLAVGQLREITLPELWPPGLKVPNIKNNCLRCHLEVGGSYTFAVVDFAESTHDVQRLSCDMCHGGDTNDDVYSHARAGYIGTHPGQSRERCVDCHWISAKIFEDSGHFKEEYDWRFPRCYECHNEHAIGKGEILIADACTSCHGERASAESGEGESAIIWKGPSNGSYGNSISITLVADGANQDLSIEHRPKDVGADLIVHLETDGDGNPISLAEDVIFEVSNDQDLLHVIYCEEGDGYLGEDVAQPTAAFNLEGGSDYDVKYPDYVELVEADDALWDSLLLLREARHRTPADLDKAIVALKKRMMEWFHASPEKLDPEEAGVVVRETKRIVEWIDEFVNGPNGSEEDGKTS